MAREFRVGTRGSRLARAQTDIILERLRRAQPAAAFRVVEIKTEGDRRSQAPLLPLAGRGIFVKELEQALREGRIDLAVHSLKDLPSAVSPDLCLAAIGAREDPRDALVSRERRRLSELAPGARLGTSSPRRVAQLRAFRPDLDLLPIRGNVDSRVRKVSEGGPSAGSVQALDGIVLALAGLKRLGLEGQAAEVIPTEVCLPAVGQGALAIETRADDSETIALARLCDHEPTRWATAAERAFLHALGGGCQTPIAAYGRLNGQTLALDGLVAAPDGSRLLRERVSGAAQDAESLGQELARRMFGLGARELIATYG
ncbi:MAG: hydroxymethylbilane synthase [Chloroflexi bacterium]|nr:hydroxymethylbilane synthase [Chloroflexota bacterium]